MGSTSYLTKPKMSAYRAKSGSSAGSDREINGKLKRNKMRRPKMDYGLKRVPDYTELAYKEAVSKLRYFLSGNYAPSIRSYGGSASIKQLDESDGDLDRKCLEKPRPRLTAKYTSLYADSLHNYSPHKTVPVAPPTTAPADLTGGTNPDVINFIQKQEEYIEQLERESQYCRDELNNLLGKVKEVISENEHLHEAQKNKLISRMFQPGSETDEDLGDSTGRDSDHQATITKTRKLRSRGPRLEGPNIVFESRIAELEAQLTQSRIDLKKVQDENNENKRKLASGLVDSTCLDGFKRQIDNLQRDKSSLESQISRLKSSLEAKDGDLEGRFKRGDVLEQQLRDERNNLENEVRRLKEDLSAERAKIRELVGEGSRRAIQERSAAEQRYNAHCDSLQHELAAQYDSVAKLQLDLERQRREENELKRELSMKNSAIEELKMELKGKTASLQADLTQAHAEKASSDEELASARLAIERHQRQSKHETNRLNSEIQSLRQRLDRADADLVHSRRENLRLTEQISTLEKELNMRSLTPNSPEKKKEKEMSSMLDSIENKHAKTVAELESMIHSQNSLMEKLTGECRLLTDKLDDASRRHKAEKTHLLCRNAELMRKLRNLWCSHKKYCTTTIARSYTPLSGYPNSSYDLDRTYYTSTPYRNRFRQDKEDALSREFNDLSIDRIDSDDDPVKVRGLETEVIEVVDSSNAAELATLQRQVDSLGRSLQPATPSARQAPASHLPEADRNVPSTTGSRPDHPGTDAPGHSYQPIQDIRAVRDVRDEGRTLSKQSSRTSLKQAPETVTEPTIEARPEDTTTSQVEDHPMEHDESVDDLNEHVESEDNYVEEKPLDHSQESYQPEEQPVELNQEVYQSSGQDYETSDQNYVEKTEPYYAEGQEVPQEGYDPNYQQNYQEGQFENYEQYPQQQYTDPNAQYTEGQYDNYATDGTYQQQYDPTQYVEPTPQYEAPQNAPIEQEIAPTDSKRSNSPEKGQS